MERREHIGDGVYVHFTGYSIEVSVNDHRNPPVAHLELDAVDKLKAFKDNWVEELKKQKEDENN